MANPYNYNEWDYWPLAGEAAPTPQWWLIGSGFVFFLTIFFYWYLAKAFLYLVRVIMSKVKK